MEKNHYIVSSGVLQNAIDVWFCRPDEITDTVLLAHYASLLSAQEKLQQKRFHFPKDRHRYLVSHALVRNVLSKYANISPSQWCFKINSHGRPEIEQSTSGVPLKFNLTHTENLCACVVTLGLECGIDVESCDRKNDLMKIAQRMFARSEIDSLALLQGAEQREAFFKFWTLREAYVKALGTGLAGSSQDFYFSIMDKEIRVEFDDARSNLAVDKGRWQFTVFDLSDIHAVAVAVKKSSADKLFVVIKKDCGMNVF